MTPPAPHATNSYPLVDTQIMTDWTNDLEPSDVMEILDRVPQEARECLHALQNAIDQDNAGMAKRAAHRLKGMAANLGALRLAQEAKHLEISALTLAEMATLTRSLQRTSDETIAALSSIARSLPAAS
jgi:HPt (histidine-containing phosphotransfer) domain-containing protein